MGSRNMDALQLSELASRVQADEPLMSLIKEKYRIKNTTGYSINALADFAPTDPIEILQRIMIGSEGTLGFVSQVGFGPDFLKQAASIPCKPNALDPPSHTARSMPASPCTLPHVTAATPALRR